MIAHVHSHPRIAPTETPRKRRRLDAPTDFPVQPSCYERPRSDNEPPETPWLAMTHDFGRDHSVPEEVLIREEPLQPEPRRFDTRNTPHPDDMVCFGMVSTTEKVQRALHLRSFPIPIGFLNINLSNKRSFDLIYST